MFVALSFILLIISTSSATENNITTENHEQTEFDKYQETLEQNNIENKEISYNTITKQKTDNVKESDGNDENTDKIDTQVSIDSLNVGKYNENVTISGKFTEINGKTISNSNVKIIINGKKYFSRTDTTGTYNFTNKITAVGTNNLTVGYSGNIKYNPYETNTTFNVEKQDIIVTHNPIEDTLYKNNITITGKFTDANEKIITNSNVKIIINVIKYYAKTDTTGTYNFTYETNTLGTNNLTIGYSGNDKYNPYETNTTFNVFKYNVTVTYDDIKRVPIGDNVTITGKFFKENGKIMSNSNVRIFFNGVKYYAKTDTTGTYIFTNITNTVGVNNVSIGYSGNDKYYEFTTNTTFEVYEKVDPDIRIAGSEIHPGQSKTFFALIPDATGTVTLKIDDTVIGEDLPLEDGQILYTYKIPEDYKNEKYILTLIYSGDEEYKPATVNVTLTLTPVGGKINTTIQMDNYTVKYSETENILVNLNNDAFGSVLFEINNTDVSEIVNFTDGNCVFAYTANLNPGEYDLIATYTGNYMYRPISVNSTLKIEKLSSKITVENVTAKAGNITLFEAKVVDEIGNNIKNMNVNFSLNENLIGSNKTNSDGIVRLYYKLPASLYEKQYNIIARSTATETVLNSTGYATLKLKQLKTRVMVPDISTIPSKYITITATVVDEFNNSVTKGNITFKKDNTTIATVEVDNGYAKYQYESNYETASLSYIYANYVGDWKYSNSKGNGTYKVTKLKTSITSSSLEAKPNSEILFTARLLDELQNPVTEGNVTFTLAGKVLGTVEISKGNARLRYDLKGYGVGEYRIQCEYHESPIYKASSCISMLTVTRYATSITGNPINAVVGNTTEITLNIVDEEKYNVANGTVNYYINDEFIGSANVSNGYASLNYSVSSKYDGKTVKYYATYVKNDIYDSSSYSNTMVVSHQKVVYVSPNGSDSNLGDQSHPFKTLEHAINHITLFGTVYLSEGTYTASGIYLNNSITIIGSGRDNTIIDGSKSGNPIFNMSKRNVVLTIDGVTIQNGKSNKEFSAGAIVTSGKLTITNSRFKNNTASGNFSGGAIYTNGILNVTNTEFINNTVTNVNSQGGAIRTYDNITYITNCSFDSNKVLGNNSTGASVLYCDAGDLIINGTVFNNNLAKGKYVTGGVIRIIGGAMVIDNCVFTKNKITGTDYGIGGVIGSLSGGVSILNSKFNSNIVNGTNTAGAAAIYIETAVLEINNSEIKSNKVISKEAYGGAIYGFKAFITMTNNTISYNMLNTSVNGFGGALYTFEGRLTINNTTFQNNTVRSKEMALAGVLYSNSNVTITNSNLINNNINASELGGGAIANMGNLTVSHCNFINNYAYDAGNAITSTDTATNVIEDNYWNSTSPEWDKLLNGLSNPNSYSRTRFTN
ncbi:MAG: hypothetical protein VZR33_04415 [Methanosphaera sp.]|nr:hypothetical protein [Methanosphaera sp.]